MKSTHQDFPYPGHMSLTVRNSVGAIKVETDPDAVGARVYLDGEVLDGVTITPNGERLEVDLGSPRGSMYGAASAGTGGREIRNDLSGSTRGTVMQIGWADSIDAPEGATVIPNGGGGATIFYEDQDPEVLGSFLGMDKGSRTATATNPDVTIVLPPHSNVTLRDVSQGATLSGEFGTLGTFDTIKGPITTEGTFREVSFATEGDITVRGVAADSTFDLRAEGNGKIVMDRVYGHGNAKTVNGDITVTVANPDGMVDLSSAHGDIAATATTPLAASSFFLFSEHGAAGEAACTYEPAPPLTIPPPNPNRRGVRSEDLGRASAAQPSLGGAHLPQHPGVPPHLRGRRRQGDDHRQGKSPNGPTAGF